MQAILKAILYYVRLDYPKNASKVLTISKKKPFVKQTSVM